MKRPIIGISPDLARVAAPHGETDRLFLNLDYAQCIIAAGGQPVVLPPVAAPEDLLNSVDALLLTGGGDVAPSRYGATNLHPETYGISDLRDEFEIALIHAALERHLPLLAICRGLQILNVALGGTLLQHIPDDRPGSLEHRQQLLGIPSGDTAHPVVVHPGSLLARIVGEGILQVNSYHHQAVDKVAPNAVVSAVAPDGIVEAFELPQYDFVLAVQWHPERLCAHHPPHRALFTALVQAATRSRASGTVHS